MAALSVRLLAQKVQPPRISKFRYSPRTQRCPWRVAVCGRPTLEGHGCLAAGGTGRVFQAGRKNRQKKQQTIVYARCEHGTGLLLELHNEHRLLFGALSPHRPPEPCPRILLWLIRAAREPQESSVASRIPCLRAAHASHRVPLRFLQVLRRNAALRVPLRVPQTRLGPRSSSRSLSPRPREIVAKRSDDRP